jgi:hypothetical protein
MPITAELNLQVGQEVTSDGSNWGVPVAPTIIAAGIDDIELAPIVDIHKVEEMCGTLVNSKQSLVQMVGGSASISGLASYDDMPYWFQGLFGSVVATSDANGWLREYNAPFQSSDLTDVVSYTILEGDGTNNYSLVGATVNTLNITGEAGAPLEVSVDFIGKAVTTDAAGALACRTVSFIMGDHVQLYIDPGSDAFGTTLTSDIAFSFDLTIEANREVKRKLNDLTPTNFRNAKFTGTLDLSLEHDVAVENMIDEIVSATVDGVGKNVRLYAIDSSSNSMTIDFAGVLDGEPGIFQDVDGIVSADLSLSEQLNSGDTNWLTVTVVNGTETLV